MKDPGDWSYIVSSRDSVYDYFLKGVMKSVTLFVVADSSLWCFLSIEVVVLVVGLFVQLGKTRFEISQLVIVPFIEKLPKITCEFSVNLVTRFYFCSIVAQKSIEAKDSMPSRNYGRRISL